MICPNCGFDVKRRAMGEGTKVDPLTPLSFTENQILPFVDAIPQDVRDIQSRLIAVDIKKNYHQVQAALSTLVGRNLVRMDVKNFPPRYYR